MKAKDIYINPTYQKLFEYNQLFTFEDFWSVSTESVEKGNIRRGGWSDVGRLKLFDAQGQEHVFFIKRQQNHFTRIAKFLFKKMPTLLKEFLAIEKMRSAKVGTITPAFFSWVKIENDCRAVMLTEELSGYRSLKDYFLCWRDYSYTIRKRILSEVAHTVRQMHDFSVCHNCLYPKHIFIYKEHEKFIVKIIDLERCQWPISSVSVFNRDMSTLYRRARLLSKNEKIRFLKNYLREEKISIKSKKMVNRFLKKEHQFSLKSDQVN